MTNRIHLCSCNKTLPLNSGSAAGLGQVLGQADVRFSDALCRRDVGQFLQTMQEPGQPVLVACTQERALFSELAQSAEKPLRFVNLREKAGWSAEASTSLPKMAALLAQARLPEPEPVPVVTYSSAGHLLIIGSPDVALPWARKLATRMEVSVVLTSGQAHGERLADRAFPVFSGAGLTLRGHLGAFQLSWQQSNPVDLDACTRCNACISVCPEQAIDFSYQIDMERCRGHRDCVKACGNNAAIDFERDQTDRSLQADLVLDLSRTPLLRQSDLPQGYAAAGKDVMAQQEAVFQLSALIGEFEKPRFFSYKSKICAHGRNRKTGCHACIDVCSTAAISSAGDQVSVDPHLCAGCGACTTVCPTGAISYAWMRPSDTGLHLRTMLAAFRQAGGAKPALLWHSRQTGEALIQETGQRARNGGKGLPASLLPFAVHHTASIGMEIWLSAVAYGISTQVVLLTDEEAPEYRAALEKQAGIAQAILSGLGYAGQHIHLLQASDAAGLEAALYRITAAAQRATVPGKIATFHISDDKRQTLDFALSHLAAEAPQTVTEISLPSGAPFGTVEVNTDACTLCMACTGVCPASALMDNPSAPQLRFVEHNCVQCGLCETTCPEQAISLQPRLRFDDAVRQARVLNEAQPFHCIRCQRPFATAKMIENMLSRLGAHGAFAGHSERLQMCGDCRVADMMLKGETPRT